MRLLHDRSDHYYSVFLSLAFRLPSYIPFSSRTPYNRILPEHYFILPSKLSLWLLHFAWRNLILVFALDAVPLFLVPLVVNVVGRNLGDLIVFKLLRKNEVEDDCEKGSEGETFLHDQDNGVEEARQGCVAAAVCEDIAEPTGI